VIFQKSPNITRPAARDILVNFEISLVVFIPNTPRNHAISYTYNNDEIFMWVHFFAKIQDWSLKNQ